MTVTSEQRRSAPEATRLPKRLSFKNAKADAVSGGVLDVDEKRGIVTAIVSVTGVVDEVDDVILPGAYVESFSKRTPKVVWAHSWSDPIGKCLYVEELMPGDERLPTLTRDGKPWPKEAGAVVATMQFMMGTEDGRKAFEIVRFYSESAECEYSIGYQVPPGKATKKNGVRFIKALECYEFSVVLFGAHTMTGTLSIKSAFDTLAVAAVKGIAAIDFTSLAVKAPVPPQFEKDDDKDEPGDETAEAEGDGKPCTCCAGTGEHSDGHECYVCGSAGTLDAQSEGDGTVPEGEPLVCAGHHGRVESDPEIQHEPDEVSPDAPPPGTPIAGDTDDDGTEDTEEVQAVEAAKPGQAPGFEAPDVDESTAAAQRQQATTDPAKPPKPVVVGEEPPEGTDPVAEPEKAAAEGQNVLPDFSDGVMVAVYPDPAAAVAIANHISGPDLTIPQTDLHCTLAYLGKVGDPDVPTEQQVVDAVMRAVEGQPALTGEVGGIGTFPPGDYGTPTWAPLDVAGLSLLREHIVSTLGDAVHEEHGFTPHITLGYNLGLIQPVPATPVTINAVRVVYGTSQRDITLGAAVPEQKAMDAATRKKKPTLPGEGDRFPIGNVEDLDNAIHAFGRAKDKDKDRIKRWIIKRARELDAVSHLPESWNVSEKKALAYDPSLDVKPISFGFVSDALAEAKAGGADRNRGGAEKLRRYWTTGEGGAKIAWGTPGDFTRCVGFLEEHMPGRAEGYCANRHKEMTGMWPGDRDNKGLDTVPVVEQKSFPDLAGSDQERMNRVRQAIAAQYADEVDEHGHSTVWIDLRASWPGYALYGVQNTRQYDAEQEFFFVTYEVAEDGFVALGDPEPVDLAVVPVPRQTLSEGDIAAEDFGFADGLPLVESVMTVASHVKTAYAATLEAKAGRVLSGANERALRTALQHLVNVLAAAGVVIDEATPDEARPTSNGGEGDDVRREIDPRIDTETNSPVASKVLADLPEDGPAVLDAKSLEAVLAEFGA